MVLGIVRLLIFVALIETHLALLVSQCKQVGSVSTARFRLYGPKVRFAIVFHDVVSRRAGYER